MALSLYDTNEIFIPSWVYDQAFVFVIGPSGTGQLFDSTVFSGTAEFGYSSISSDGASGVWFGPFAGNLINYDSSGVTSTFPYSGSGVISLGNVLSVSGQSFAVDASGRIFTVSGVSMAQVNTWPSTPARELVSALGQVWGMLPTISGVGSLLAGSPYTSGVVTVPMTHVACIAGSSGMLAVGGWNPASIPSGFSALAFDPTGGSVLLAAGSVTASSLSLWTTDGSGIWSPTGQSVTGIAGINSISWSPVGTALFATSASANSLYVLSYLFGTLALAQTLPLSGAAAVAITLDSVHGLVCQPSLDSVTPISLVGSGWVSGTPFAIATPQTVVDFSAIEMQIGNASGITDVTLTSGGIWNINGTTSLPFNPTQLIQTAPGTIAAVGTSGSSGYVYTQGVTGIFAGSADGLFAFRDQYVVADNTNSLLHVFQYFNGAFTERSTITAPSGVGNLYFGGINILAPASGLTSLYRLAAPFTLRNQVSGQVSLYNGSTWTNIFLNAEQQPECLAFDVSGQLSVVTLQNQLITIWSSSGVILPSGIANIPTFSGQLSGVPIGFSEIAWIYGALYATSSLNEAFIQIGGVSDAPSGGPTPPPPTPPPLVGIAFLHSVS